MKKPMLPKTLDFLLGGGKMGELIRSIDWCQTPLGSPDGWPQSLRTSISICIASNFPIAISWGPNRVQIYNDGYWPITGNMHPKSMGQDFAECWASAWPVIGQAFEEASLGATRFLENQRIFLDRHGYLEETFFTFSFSPILDESGSVGGLFHPVVEQTQQTLAERRLNILPVFANCTVNAKTTADACKTIMDCLKDFELDIPFVLLYSLTADGKKANLKGNIGIEKKSPLAVAEINLEKQSINGWPFTEVLKRGKMVQVEKLTENFGTFHCGPYSETPQQALIFPLTLPGDSNTNYFLVTGVSARRRLDEKYLLFYKLLTASVANVLTKVQAYEIDQKKAKGLAEIDKAKTVFFSNISHEFRTPLTLMLSPLEELLNQSNNFSETEINYIETSHRNAMRLLKLVNTLLDFSRIEAGRQQTVFSLVDIVKLTKNLAANFRSVIEKAGLKFIIKANSSIQPMYIDKELWEKIIFNLISNAFKYTLKGKIIVELLAETDHAVLKIIDTGVGIPENELPKMFERFHRIQNATGRTHEGTGIGLSLVRELVLMHKGIISVESKLNYGSTFTVKIPFDQNHIQLHQLSGTVNTNDQISSNLYIEEIENILKAEDVLNSNLDSNKSKSNLPIVLVVDDNADMRQHIRSILSNEFNVITANNGVDALKKMKKNTPVLVLSDIMMPVMDGMALLKEIKSNKATALIPVIFLTARSGEDSKIEGWETGADDYLVKPFSSKEIVARIKAQIKMVKLRQSLETNVRNLFLEAPAAIAVVRGKQFIFELANTIYLQLIGNRDIIGKSIRKALPELKDQGFFEILDTVYNTGRPFIGNEVHSMLDKGNGKLENVYFNYVNQPSHNSEGVIDGILIYGIDVTEQVESRKKIEESEKQHAFLLKLSDALRSLSNPVDIEETVTKIAMDFMDADRCYYNTLEEGKAIVLRDAFRGDLTSVAGVYPLNSFALFKAVVDAGHPFIVDNVYTSDIIEGQLKKICVQLQIISMINIPIIKSDKPVGILTLVQNKPRKWTDSEVQLTIETAERTWAAVERAKAEEALRKSEEKYRTLFTSIDQGYVLCELVRNKEGIGIDYYMLELNPTYEKQTGISIEMVLGKTILQAFPTMKKEHIDTFAAVVDNQCPVVYEQYFEVNQRWHEVKVYPGVEDRFTVLFSDITERKVIEEKIKESESRFRIMADASPLLIWTIDANGLSSYYNKTLIDFIGVSKDEDISDWKKIVHPKDIQSTFNTINTAIAEQHSYALECRLLRFDGNWRWMLTHGNPLIGANNEFLGFIGSAVDITERKQAEEKIKESEAKYRSLIAAAPIGIGVFVGRDLVMESANQQLIDIIGKGANVAGKRLTEIMPELVEYGQPYLKILENVFTTGEMYQSFADPVSILRNGVIHYEFYDINYVPLFDAEGKVYAILDVAIDVTVPTQLNKKIKASEEKFRLLVSQAPVAICVLRGEDYKIEVINERMLGMWDLLVEQVVYKPAFDVLLEFKKQGFKEILDHVYKTNQRFVAEELPINVIRNEKLENAFVKFVFEPLRDANGTISDVMVLAHEITEQVVIRKKIEESEKLLEHKVIERTLQLSRKNIELQNMNKELEAFTYISSHDLQEPLRKIQTFAGRIIAKEKEHLSESAKDYFCRIQDAAARMQTLIQDLLDFSRVNTSERKFEKIHLDVILNQVKVEFKEVLEEKNGNISTSEMCEVNIIPFQFHQLFYNLISNALKFSKPNVPPYIIVKSKIIKDTSSPFYPKGACKISIADNGIGFDKQFSERIFRVFQKLHGKDEYAGTGIGLAIVKKIVENHNGIITAESKLGNGATFIIYLPE